MRGSASGVSKSGMRTRNLSALLTAIHYRPGVSRVELAAALGLSKTTISALVDELIDAQLVESAGAEARVGAGRPGALLTPASGRAVLVVNPEIDVTTIAMVAMGGRILHKHRVPNSTSRPVTVARVAQQVARYLRLQVPSVSTSIEAAVIAVPGAVAADGETVVAAPSLRWRAVRAGAALERVLGMPVATINNARAATVGEGAFGALRDHHNGVCIFSGSGGIGGGLLINDVVVTGAGGLAGEIGRMRIHDPELGQPGNPTLEYLMQRDALVAELGFSTLDDEQFLQELRTALAARPLPKVHEQSRVLANAIATLRDLLDPEVIVLGGYLGALCEALGPDLLHEVNRSALAPLDAGFLVPRSVGLDDMVLLGAAETHWKRVLADPSEAAHGAQARDRSGSAT